MGFNTGWWGGMIAKHGSEEAVRQFMRESGNKSRRNTGGTGGFASMQKDKLTEVSTKGGHARAEKYKKTTGEETTSSENPAEGKETNTDQA